MTFRILPILFITAGIVVAQPPNNLVPQSPESPSIQQMFQRRVQSQPVPTQSGSISPQGSTSTTSDEDSLELLKMSIDFIDADLSEIFRTVSSAYGISIITDKDVSGKATVHLKDVPVREGLESLCSAHGLEVFREGRIMRIRKASEKTINILKMNMQRIDLDVQNRDVKEFIKEFSDKTGLKILAGSDLTGTVTGSWKNVVPLDGFKALMEVHGYRIKQKNGFYLVTGAGKEGPNQNPMAKKSGGVMDIEVKDGRVSINLEGADLQEVIRNIAEQAKLNIVFYGDAKESVNATISNVTFDEVFSTILKGSRYTYVLTAEGTLLVGEKGAKSALSANVMIPLRYLKSENALKLIPKSLLDGGLQITDVKEQNGLLVSGAMSEIDNARQFLSLIDVPTLQIALECIIVEYNRGKDFAFGINSGSAKKSATGQPAINASAGFAPVDSVLSKSMKWPNAALSVGLMPESFQFELASSEGSNKAQVLARPSISTLNGNKATINVTNTSYTKVISANTNGLQSVDYRPFNDGISLEITPSVTQAGSISIDIAPEIKTSANKSCEDCPRDVSTRTLRTTVNLRDGQTVRLGGLIRSAKTKTRTGVPFFGSLPLVGWLFSYDSEDEANTELVIYITPHVIPSDALSTDPRKDIEEMSARKESSDLLDLIAPKADSSKVVNVKPLSAMPSKPLSVDLNSPVVPAATVTPTAPVPQAATLNAVPDTTKIKAQPKPANLSVNPPLPHK